MYIFQGLDLSTIHVKPQTCDWLDAHLDDPDCDLYFKAADECGFIIWVYSVCDDEKVLKTLPPDLAECIRYAFRLDCRFIYLDPDAHEAEDLPNYEAEWEALAKSQKKS